jgi:chromosome segregation ATPase
MDNDSLEKPNGTVDEKLDWLITAVQSMDSRLVNLDSKVDKRLRETQPMWEGVQAQLAEVKESLQRHGEMLERHGEMLQRHDESLQRLAEDVTVLRGEVASLRAEVGSLRADTEKGFRTIDRRMERQLGEFERLHAYQRDLEDRMDRIEKLSTP